MQLMLDGGAMAVPTAVVGERVFLGQFQSV
jgi:hypothetical protein